MGTMMALRAHARGGPEQLVYEQAPAPAAGPGEVLIAVHAAAITFAELTWDLSWRTVISQTFPLAEGQKAFESGGGVRRPGKTVLVVR